MLCPNCRTIRNMKQACAVNWSGTNFGLVVCDNCQEYLYAKSPANISLGETRTRPRFFIRSCGMPHRPSKAVREEFTEALRCLNGGNYKAAVVMTRGTLQASTRALEAKGSNLYQEIDDLAGPSLMPASIHRWAHEIRDGGSLVAHAEHGKRINPQDAEELVELATSIFEYLCTIPAEVARRRAPVAPGGGAPSA